MPFPGVYNFTLTRGSQFSVVGLQLIGGNGPFDLTGFSVASQVKIQPLDTVILDLQPIVADATSGMIEIPSISGEDTSILPLGVYQYDMLLIDIYNEVFPPFLRGQFYIIDKDTKEP